MKKFLSLVVVLGLLAWSIALFIWTFYVPYKYFTDEAWLIENLGLIASLPIQWYVAWLAGEYFKKFLMGITFDAIFLFVPKRFHPSAEQRESIIQEAMNKKPWPSK